MASIKIAKRWLTMTKRVINYDKYNDGRQTATSQFFGTVARYYGSEKVIHRSFFFL